MIPFVLAILVNLATLVLVFQAIFGLMSGYVIGYLCQVNVWLPMILSAVIIFICVVLSPEAIYTPFAGKTIWVGSRER